MSAFQKETVLSVKHWTDSPVQLYSHARSGLSTANLLMNHAMPGVNAGYMTPAQTPRRSSARTTASNQRGCVCGTGEKCLSERPQLAIGLVAEPHAEFFLDRSQRMRAG